MKKAAFLLTLALTLIGFALTICAAQPSPEHPPPRLFSEPLPLIPYLETGPPQPQSRSDPLAADFVPWSKLVFQSFRDRSWEIYIADADGSRQTRITADGATDIQPRLNPGCTRVVFATNRTGADT